MTGPRILGDDEVAVPTEVVTIILELLRDGGHGIASAALNACLPEPFDEVEVLCATCFLPVGSTGVTKSCWLVHDACEPPPGDSDNLIEDGDQ